MLHIPNPPGGGNVCDPVFRSLSNPACMGTTICTKIDNPIAGKIEETMSSEKFYISTKPGEATVNVPTLVTMTFEEIKFCKKTINFICCEVDICVPDEICVTTYKRCELAAKKVKLDFRVRRTGGVDVYVLGLPGFPKEYVLELDVSTAHIKQKYGIDL